jgi:hypothetical protein
MVHAIGLGWLIATTMTAPFAGVRQLPDYPTFRPIKTDPIAVQAHQKLSIKVGVMTKVLADGSNPRIKPATEFSSAALQERLKNDDWPMRRPPFDFVPDFRTLKGRFDLADAYAYCYIAHIELGVPSFGENGESLRPWPAAKIRRQFQRALSSGLAVDLSQKEREELYYALVRSAAIAHGWWLEIGSAVNARGDVALGAGEDAEFVVKWLMGIEIWDIETQYVKAGIQRKIEPRPHARKPPP